MNSFISKFKLAKAQHDMRSNAYLKALKAHIPKFDSIKIDDLSNLTKPLEDYDLIVTLGGDGTFLKTASYIHDETPILGLNTDSERSYCTFCSFNPNLISMEPDTVWNKVFNSDYEIKKRTRIKFGVKGPNSENLDATPEFQVLNALNEVFFADKDVGKTSNFRIAIDGNDFEYYRSGGIIVATGSGTTGWIRSSINAGTLTVRDVLEAADGGKISLEQAQEIAYEIGKKYELAQDDKKLMFHIREPIMQKRSDYMNKKYTGKINKMMIQSEVKNGVIVIDGNYSRDIGFGDIVTLEPSPHDLHCLHLSQDQRRM